MVWPYTTIRHRPMMNSLSGLVLYF